MYPALPSGVIASKEQSYIWRIELYLIGAPIGQCIPPSLAIGPDRIIQILSEQIAKLCSN
jgi:hypothetical protein